MFIVMQQVLLLIMFAATGYILCKKGMVKGEHTKLLSVLQVYFFLPCNVLNTFSANFTVSYFKEKYSIILVSAAAVISMMLVAYAVSHFLTDNKYLRGVYHYSLTVANYGFFGYPLVSGIFDEIMLQNAMFFSIPMSLYAYTVGYAALTKTKLSLKRALNPTLIATMVGAVIGLTGIKLPGVVDTFIDKSTACMGPIGMLLAGMVISEFKITELLKGKINYLIALLRLAVLPIAIASTVKLLGFPDSTVITSFMMFAMPCGLNTIVFPRLVGEECGTGASLTLITSLLAILTVPLGLALFM